MKDLFNNEEIRALSWKQPFASLMYYGEKIETRTWSTKYRGLVLICVSKKPYTPQELFRITGPLQMIRINDLFVKQTGMDFHKIGKATAGTAMYIGELVDCRKMKREDEDKCFVQFNPGLYCHVYKNVRRIEPFPWKGSQGWKKLSAEDKAKINIKD